MGVSEHFDEELLETIADAGEGNIEEGKNLLYSNVSHMEEKAKELGDEDLVQESAVMKEKLADFDYSGESLQGDSRLQEGCKCRRSISS